MDEKREQRRQLFITLTDYGLIVAVGIVATGLWAGWWMR